MRSLNRLILLLFLSGCYKSAPITGDFSSKANHTLDLSIETSEGVEDVYVSTESEVLCSWLRTRAKKYGSIAHVVRVGECTQGEHYESRKAIPKEAQE